MDQRLGSETGEAAADSPSTDEVSKSANRPRVLCFLSGYLPGFRWGGPIRTIANMVDRMSEDVEFLIVTADRDLGDASAFPDISVNHWNTRADAKVFYRSPGKAGWRALLEDLRKIDFDLIYLNSMFSPSASLRPLLYRRLGLLIDRPILIAPRGELDDGALSQKPIKKWVFMMAARIAGLHRGVFWHASNAEEKLAIIRHVGAPDEMVFVAPNLSGRSQGAPVKAPSRRNGEPLRVAFLSRISPMKNLEFALDVMGSVSFPIRFDIYGVVDDAAYWGACEKRAASLPPHVAAQFKGEVNPNEVERTLSEYDLFFLPTLGENYGHAIREALSAGVPALVSDRTPWRGLIEKNAGADLPLADAHAFVQWLEKFNRLTTREQLLMRQAARLLGDDAEVSALNLSENQSMFRTILSTAAKIA